MGWTGQNIQIRRYLFSIVLLFVAVIAVWWLWRYYRVDPWTRDGRVRADVVHIAPDVSGLVTEVRVIDNMPVRRGQVLFVIDRDRYQFALAEAEGAFQRSVAEENKAQANIEQAEAGIQQAQANVLAQSALLAEARHEDSRNRNLGTLVSAENVQQGNAKVAQLSAALSQAKAGVTQATAALAQARASLGQALAGHQQAEAARDTARLNLQRTVIRAPVDGVAADVQLRPGNYLAAGHSAFGVVDAASIHVDGYFEETKLANIKVGDGATIKLMGDDRRLSGHVESIAPGISDRDRSSSGDLLANVNPTFNWIRLAQRIPIRIRIDGSPPDLLLIAGRTATVVLHPDVPQGDRASRDAQTSHVATAK
ncbi:HlyD family secretion protein [Burkholderia gladioli]|uniref:HlyD family secretion protein n=1 Tax=Burkholderia gladioli TaxID=28095 RepID=UPI001560BCCE|nr:HlyD family secretion protein [Burkholderia gladioli]NRF88367.1 HlyD family secretion protein [Burkholderia gladioli]